LAYIFTASSKKNWFWTEDGWHSDGSSDGFDISYMAIGAKSNLLETLYPREPHRERGDNLFPRCALISGIHETSNADWWMWLWRGSWCLSLWGSLLCPVFWWVFRERKSTIWYWIIAQFGIDNLTVRVLKSGWRVLKCQLLFVSPFDWITWVYMPHASPRLPTKGRKHEIENTTCKNLQSSYIHTSGARAIESSLATKLVCLRRGLVEAASGTLDSFSGAIYFHGRSDSSQNASGCFNALPTRRKQICSKITSHRGSTTGLCYLCR